MAIHSVSVETVKFVTKLVAARPTSVNELTEIITLVGTTLSALTTTAPSPQLSSVYSDLRAPAKKQRKTRAAKTANQAPSLLDAADAQMGAASATARNEVAAEAAADFPVTIIPAKRGRGRPRRAPLEAATEQVIESTVSAAPEPTAQPKLLRRAEWIAHEQELHPTSEPAIIARANDRGVVRGIVKWYDGRTGKGVLRLAGVSSDIALDAQIIERSGLKRLYKDQEVEATTHNNHGRIEVLTLSIPGRPTATGEANSPGEGEGPARRQPRPIMIEVRRDGGRQKSARAEAEQIFSNLGGNKNGRRVTP